MTPRCRASVKWVNRAAAYSVIPQNDLGVRVDSLCPLGNDAARQTALLDLNAHYHALNTYWLHYGLVLRNSSATPCRKKFGKRFDAVRYHAPDADTDHDR